ncbi:MAG: beta-ketoacyl-ACP synthase 3 [Planctomycetes bacterium]|nr:beta-ketoacyl-ACP synthase 3 [Planctomycetota bacterium]
MTSVAITAAGKCLPKQVLTNEELIARFGLAVDARWIEERTGIRSRHWLEPHETTSDLAVGAARAILARRGVEARELDRIVLATISPDHPSPSTATIVARKLGARCAAFDVSAACAGFLYALELGAAAVRGGERKVLVLAADARSRFIDTRDPRAVVLFADGAAGVLLEPSDRPGLLATHLGAEGREEMGAHIPAGGAKLPTSTETLAAGRHFLQIDARRDIFELFVRFAREATDAVLAKARLSLDDVDLFITHQGNARMIEALLAELRLPPERAVNDVVHHGNTSGATVPIALAEALESGRIRPGHRVLMASVGAGYTFGAALHGF